MSEQRVQVPAVVEGLDRERGPAAAVELDQVREADQERIIRRPLEIYSYRPCQRQTR
jgi:hypothetical protein